MSQKLVIKLFVASFVLLSFTAGCTEQMSLTFDQEGVSTYKFASETIQDFKFEQISVGKTKEEQNLTRIEMVFDQKILGVNEDGSANAKITIAGINVVVKNVDGIVFNFDSSKKADHGKSFNKLIGKSYTIKITPDGKVKSVDAADIRKVVATGPDRKWAKNLLSDKEIVRRHEIIAMPDIQDAKIAARHTWAKEVNSHPRLLEQKKFEKVYTVDNIKEQSGRKVASVSMKAAPSGAAEGVSPASGFGYMAKMFDTQENYEGQMQFDVDTGKVISFSEKMVATYTASEMSKTKPDAKGPDTLIMGLTHSISLEEVE